MKKAILLTLLAVANLSPAFAAPRASKKATEVKVSCVGPAQGMQAGDLVTGNLVATSAGTTGSLTVVVKGQRFENVLVKGAYVGGANSYALVAVDSKEATAAVDSVFMNFNDNESDGAVSYIETADHVQRPLSCKKLN